MPELGEVEWYRKQWNVALGTRITRVELHGEKRLFRGIDSRVLSAALTGSTLKSSEARSKQMLFCFAHGRSAARTAWLGIHLGMTGKLRVEPKKFAPAKHDHLALFTAKATLVFQDARMFGRVRFEIGAEPPTWWSELPTSVVSEEFTLDRLRAFLRRRARLAVKAALLVQSMFPGVGNWMADEILWRAKLNPAALCGALTKPQSAALRRAAQDVCRIALETVGEDFSDPPAGWFYHARWKRTGTCPRCAKALKTATIGGRTTRWCLRCQR